MKRCGTIIACLLSCSLISLSIHASPKKEAWMSKAAEAPITQPPVDAKLTAGQILRIKLTKGSALKIFTIGGMKPGSGVRVYAMKKGSPVVKVSRGSGTYHVFLSPREADELVVYSKAGGGTVKIQSDRMNERVLTKGERMRVTTRTGKDTFARIVNVATGDSGFLYTWFNEGTEMPEHEIGPTGFRSTTLDEPGEVKEIKWDAPGDTLIIEATDGTVLVKAGQPFN